MRLHLKKLIIEGQKNDYFLFLFKETISIYRTKTESYKSSDKNESNDLKKIHNKLFIY